MGDGGGLRRLEGEVGAQPDLLLLRRCELGLREPVDVPRRAQRPRARGAHPRPRVNLTWGAHEEEIVAPVPEVGEDFLPEGVIR
eukprot:15229813-Alexandrium_andersonii.AAC.1